MVNVVCWIFFGLEFCDGGGVVGSLWSEFGFIGGKGKGFLYCVILDLGF